MEPPRLRLSKVASQHLIDVAATPPNLGGEFHSDASRHSLCAFLGFVCPGPAPLVHHQCDRDSNLITNAGVSDTLPSALLENSAAQRRRVARVDSCRRAGASGSWYCRRWHSRAALTVRVCAVA